MRSYEMRFETTPAFDADFRALAPEHQRMFRDRIGLFSDGCDAWGSGGPEPWPWPANLRVHQLVNTMVWSMTWHYRRPNGRATFQFIPTKPGLMVRWRRIGGHDI